MTSWVDIYSGDPVAVTGTGYAAYSSATTITLALTDPLKAGVSMTASSQELRLWPALTFSIGQSFVVYNLGANSFTIKTHDGVTTVGTAATGTAYYITLLDNLTDAGTWDVLRPFGGPGSGTLTSVAMTVPSFLSVAGSPITTAGTLAVTLATQTANTIFAGPTTGSAAAPTFRAMVAADMLQMVGDSGSGGVKGAVPAPAAGDAAAGKFLGAAGTWSTPGGSGASTSNQYVVLSAAGDLTQERILTMGTGMTGVDAGAGAAYTLSVTNPLPSPSASAFKVPRVNASANAYELVTALTGLTRVATGTTAADTLTISAYDVDGASYTDMITLTANNTPTLTMRQVFFSTTTGIIGSTTNDSAAAGSVGEYVSSTIASGSAVSLTTNVAADITSISLTAGDWDVWIDGSFGGDAATTIQVLAAYVSTTSATIDLTPGRRGAFTYNGANILNLNPVVQVGPVRLSVASPTTVYFVVNQAFSGGTCTAFGIIQARRRR